MKLLNAFSISMVDRPCTVRCTDLNRAEAADLLREAGLDSFVGHADTAAVLSRLLGQEVTPRRESIKLSPGEVAVVAQYSGPRLPEGSTMLPEGARLDFVKVQVTG